MQTYELSLAFKDADILSAAMNINSMCLDINANETVVIDENAAGPAGDTTVDRNADKILEDQSLLPPQPYVVKEILLNNTSVPDGVQKLLSATPSTSTADIVDRSEKNTTKETYCYW